MSGRRAGHGTAWPDAPPLPEVWLRGPIDGVTPLLMPAAHALLQARDEIHRVVPELTPAELHARPGGIASPAFHLRHVAGVLDRMLTYARGDALSDAQFVALRREEAGGDDVGIDGLSSMLAAIDSAVDAAMRAYRTTPVNELFDIRTVGRAALPSTVFGVLFHAAEHAQRHAGQLVTTTMLLRGLRGMS